MKEVYGSMALDTKKLYTTKDIMDLPDGVRAELIDGEIFYMATPNHTHQALLRELSFVFVSYQKKHKGGCETLFAPYAVFINRDEHNYLEPDLLIICPHGEEDDRHQKDGCHGGPDFVLEIVSPSSKRMDYIKKPEKYEAAGVREYWIVDPQTERVLVYNFEKDSFLTQYTFEDTIPVGIYGDFSIDFKELKKSAQF
ncbi:MAG: Uma2 family endonuclease [Eubacteriales bacterium]|nr:Uma2 family endonuclease [Eubacteriales bacterium]